MAQDDKAIVGHRHTTSDIRGGRFPEGMLPSTIIPSIEAAQATAASKSKVIFSDLAASGTDFSNGDTWYQRIAGIIIAQWEFTGGAWAARTLDGAVVANLDASKITTGTLAAGTKITAGDPLGSRVELDSGGLRKYAADGTSVQVDLTGDVAAFSGLITGSEIVGGEIKTAVDGNRIEVTPYGVTGGEVRFYTGHPDEASPGKIWTEGWQGDPGYQVGMLQVVPPRLNTGYPPSLYLESGKHDTDSALDYTKVSMNATFIALGSTGSGTKEIFLGADALIRRFDMAESFVGGTSYERWGALRFFVVDSSLPWSSPGSLTQLVNYGLPPTVAAPLLVWDMAAAPGAQLKSTTNGTTWTVIGGGGGGGGVPTGTVLEFAGATAPGGFLTCNGSAVSRTTYADLYSAIGTLHGVGDGTTTFNLPDKRSRFPVGYDASDSDYDAVGKTGGSKDHSHAAGTLAGPAHTHPLSSLGQALFAFTATAAPSIFMRRVAAATWTATHQGSSATTPASSTVVQAVGAELDGTTNSSGTGAVTGSSATADGRPPYIAMNYIIKT